MASGERSVPPILVEQIPGLPVPRATGDRQVRETVAVEVTPGAHEARSAIRNYWIASRRREHFVAIVVEQQVLATTAVESPEIGHE